MGDNSVQKNLKDVIYTALGEFGVQEVPGPRHNSRILEYFKDIGQGWVVNDETAWCSAFASWVCKEAGLDYATKLNARSWLDVGEPVSSPMIGDIVVLWRENPKGPFGHVGFFISVSGELIYLLGGNQSNTVKISAYQAKRVLGYRRIPKI